MSWNFVGENTNMWVLRKKIDGKNIVQKERVKFEKNLVSKGNENGQIKWILCFCCSGNWVPNFPKTVQIEIKK